MTQRSVKSTVKTETIAPKKPRTKKSKNQTDPHALTANDVQFVLELINNRGAKIDTREVQSFAMLNQKLGGLLVELQRAG